MFRVLVADDEPAILRLWERVLRSTFQVQVVLAEDGASAMARLDEGGIDLLVTDHRMPRFTGVEVIARARRQRRDLPVVLVTGDPRELVLRDASGLGVDVVLEKPFRIDEAVVAVRRALSCAGIAATGRRLARGAP